MRAHLAADDARTQEVADPQARRGAGAVRHDNKESTMTIQFFQTRMGAKFYEVDVPRIARALERIADGLNKKTDAAPTCIDCGQQIPNDDIEAYRQGNNPDAVPQRCVSCHARKQEISERCDDYLAGFDYALELVAGYEFSSPLTSDRAREAIKRELELRRAQFVTQADRT
jgi:hypothetical protein